MKLPCLVIESDGRQDYLGPRPAFADVSRQIILVHTVHDQDDRTAGFIVQARHDLGIVLSADDAARRIILRSVWSNRIVDDDEVGSAPD